MVHTKRFWIVLVVTFGLFFITSMLIITIRARHWIEQKASSVFGASATVNQVNYQFPFGAVVKGFTVDGIFYAETIRFGLNPTAWLSPQLHLKGVHMDHAVLTLHVGEHANILDVSSPGSGAGQTEFGESFKKSRQSITLVIDELTITDSQIVFPLHPTGPAVNLSLQGVNLKAQNVSLGEEAKNVPFELSARLLDADRYTGKNQVTAKGWINWPLRNMQLVGQVRDWRDFADVDIQMDSIENQLTVQGRLQSKGGVSGAWPSMEQSETDMMAAMLAQVPWAVDLNFSFQTQMDRWELRNIDFSGNLGPSVAAKPAAE